jgi:hypothetical protein
LFSFFFFYGISTCIVCYYLLINFFLFDRTSEKKKSVNNWWGYRLIFMYYKMKFYFYHLLVKFESILPLLYIYDENPVSDFFLLMQRKGEFIDIVFNSPFLFTFFSSFSPYYMRIRSFFFSLFLTWFIVYP